MPALCAPQSDTPARTGNFKFSFTFFALHFKPMIKGLAW
jgi:hypothetical protein